MRGMFISSSAPGPWTKAKVCSLLARLPPNDPMGISDCRHTSQTQSAIQRGLWPPAFSAPKMLPSWRSLISGHVTQGPIYWIPLAWWAPKFFFTPPHSIRLE